MADYPREFDCVDCGVHVVFFTPIYANDQDLCVECSFLRSVRDPEEREKIREILKKERPAMPKPILSLDFDGVLHSYMTPWVDALTIPDPPVPGTVPWLFKAAQHFTVCVFSSRSHVEGGIDAMQICLYKWVRDDHPAGVNPLRFVKDTIKWPKVKPAAML